MGGTLDSSSPTSAPKRCAARLLDYLRNVVLYYPEAARLESRPAGLLLKPSPTHKPQRVLPMKLVTVLAGGKEGLDLLQVIPASRHVEHLDVDGPLALGIATHDH